jgi:DNA-directed RNA polymerase subunit L
MDAGEFPTAFSIGLSFGSLRHFLVQEHLKLSAEFSVDCAKTNAMFNVVSKCSYQNTPDISKIQETIEDLKREYDAKGMSKEEIEFQIHNFNQLNAQRFYVKDSFDFIIQSVGVYENKAIAYKACDILCNKCEQFIQNVQANTIIPYSCLSNSAKENGYLSVLPCNIAESFDIVLENEDYTLGKVLEYYIYENFYQGEKTLTYCGFKKFHPHDTYSVIRIAYQDKPSLEQIKENLVAAGKMALETFKKMRNYFR